MMRPRGQHSPVSWESYKKIAVSSAEYDQDSAYSRIKESIQK